MTTGSFRRTACIIGAVFLLVLPLAPESGEAAELVLDRVGAMDFGGAWVTMLAYGPDGINLCCGLNTGRIQVLAVYTRLPAGSWEAHSDVITGLDMDRSGNLVISTCLDGSMKLWSVPEGELLQEFEWGDGGVTAVEMIDSQNLITFGTATGVIGFYDIGSRDTIMTVSVHQDVVSGLSASLDETITASAGNDGTVKVWDMTRNAGITIPSEGHACINCIAMSEDGSMVACGGRDGLVRLCGTDLGKKIADLRAGNSGILGLDFYPGKHMLLACSEDGNVYVWDWESLTLLADFRAGKGPARAVKVTDANLGWVWVACDDSVKVWGLRSNEPPVINLTAPSAGVVTPSPCRLDLSATDDHGLRWLKVELNGEVVLEKTYRCRDTLDKSRWGEKDVEISNADFLNLKEGSNTLRIEAADCDGEVTQAGPVTVRYSSGELIVAGRMLDAGVQNYYKARFNSAVRSLSEAISNLEQHVTDEEDTGPLIRAYLFLGCSHVGLGSTARAKEAFGAAKRLNPRIAPDGPPFDSPKVRAIFADTE